MPWQAQIDAAVESRREQMIAVRRHLHAHPEPSNFEHETSLFLFRILEEEGFDVRMAAEGRGVIADPPPAIDPGQGPFLALRADIDALRIQDQKSVSYRSQNPGIMHACGHDAHTATMLGTLLALKDLQQQGGLPCPLRVRGIFQPAEETSTGACEMVDDDALANVEGVLAIHVDPGRQAGRVGLRAGVLTANCVGLNIRIVGRGGHTARPHEAADPIAAAAQLINALYLYIPRVTDSQDAVVLGIGQVHGGDNANVIPEEVELRGTLRTLDHRIHEDAIGHIHRIAEGIASASDTEITVSITAAAPAVRNDSTLIELLRRAAGEVLGPDGIDEIPRPSMGSEDFAFYLDHVPGAMMRLGTAGGERCSSPLHSPDFDIEESTLPLAARTLARATVEWFRLRK